MNKNYPVPTDQQVENLRLKQGVMLEDYIRNVVYPNSIYYQNLFEEHHIDYKDIRRIRDLVHIPFTQKADLTPTKSSPNRIKEFVLIPDPDKLKRKPSVILQALFKGKQYVTDKLDREYRPIFMTSTTGRSSEPVPFLYTQHDLNNLAVAGAHIIDIGGARKDDKILNTFPYAPHLAYWLTHYASSHRNIFCLSTGGGKVMGTEGNIRMLTKINPQILVGMPTFVYHILSQALEQGKKVDSLRSIVLGGEKVVEGTRRRLTDLCTELGSKNVQVMATYGFTESKLAFGERPVDPGVQPHGYVVPPELGIIEIVDPETGKTVPPETPGEIVFTPLNARASVVLRYRTGDYVDGGLYYKYCPVYKRVIPHIVGKISRSSNVQSMELHKLKGTLIDFNEIEHLLDNHRSIGTWQVELKKLNNDPMEVDELIVHVCRDPDVSEETLTKDLNRQFVQFMEIKPNQIHFHSPKHMRKLQKVGQALKEEKIVDNRPTSSAAPQTRTNSNGILKGDR